MYLFPIPVFNDIAELITTAAGDPTTGVYAVSVTSYLLLAAALFFIK